MLLADRGLVTPYFSRDDDCFATGCSTAARSRSRGGAPPAIRDAAGRPRRARGGARRRVSIRKSARPSGRPEPLRCTRSSTTPRRRSRAEARTPLRDCLEQAWVAVRGVATGALIPAGAGKVVLIAPRPDAGSFAAAARAALENLARTLSVEWARYGIGAVAIAPGARTGDDELAELVCFLVSPAGEYLTGCVLGTARVRYPSVPLPAVGSGRIGALMRSRVALALAVAGVLAGALATSTSAASPISFSRPIPIKARGVAAIRSWGGASCPSRSLCVATDGTPRILTSTHPTGGPAGVDARRDRGVRLHQRDLVPIHVAVCGNRRRRRSKRFLHVHRSRRWRRDVGRSGRLNSARSSLGVSCASVSLCVAVDESGASTPRPIRQAGVPGRGASRRSTRTAPGFSACLARRRVCAWRSTSTARSSPRPIRSEARRRGIALATAAAATGGGST